MEHAIREALSFPSADGKHTIAAYCYTPKEGTPVAVLQLSHGMCEYICRYEHTIDCLCAAGIAVCGNDHLGHGHSAEPADYGFFAEKDGYQLVLKDLNQMNRIARERFPQLPLFLLGHSMGSFYARRYAELYPDTIKGLIISGTGGPNPAIGAGKCLASMIAALRGPRHISGLLLALSTGSYDKAVASEGSPHAWLTRDPEVWSAYGADPMCTFTFTVSGYRDMLTVYGLVSRKQWAKSLPKELPVLLVSGDQDPVGDYGKGVRAVHAALQQAGLKDLTLKLYPDCRHELHNEINKEEYYADLISWLKRHC